MTTQEARIIAALWMHFGCTFSKLAGLAIAIWGEDYASEMCDSNYTYGSPLGRDLVKKMADTLGLERCESDDMVMSEISCMNCKRSQWSVCYPSDTAKECHYCGSMASVFH